MKVWTLQRGCKYEGGSLYSVHATAEGARKAALKLIQEHSKFYDYQQTDENSWIDGSDFIEVYGWEVEE
jgi:hypothetical protein